MKDSRDSVASPSLSSNPFCLFTDVTIGLLRQGYGVRFYAKGWSMHPTIRDGELITVEPVIPSQVKRGDILLHYNGRSVIAHRVVRMAKRMFLLNSHTAAINASFILRGDASSTCDGPVDADQILGKVVSVERNGRLIDLDSWKSVLFHAAYVYGSRFKRSVVRNIFWRKTH